MPEYDPDPQSARLLDELYPLAEQAARILSFVGALPDTLSKADHELAARVGQVSAQQAAIVRRALVMAGFARKETFATHLLADTTILNRLAANLEGVARYRRMHKDVDIVRLVVTEPGEKSSLRTEIDRHGLPPRLFQTTDAFMNLARAAARDLVILAPFIDDHGARFLVELFSMCSSGVNRHLICRPLSEPQCGPAFRKQKSEFRRLGVTLYEYARPSPLPSGRETFHAKAILVDDLAFYVGSSNFMGSALERSLECGVIVRGQSARELYTVIGALKSVSTVIHPSAW